ncbi:MAG: hypothetical protein QXP27_02825 [Candidatus Methanomethyliaceae archaeon]
MHIIPYDDFTLSEWIMRVRFPVNKAPIIEKKASDDDNVIINPAIIANTHPFRRIYPHANAEPYFSTQAPKPSFPVKIAKPLSYCPRPRTNEPLNETPKPEIGFQFVFG